MIILIFVILMPVVFNIIYIILQQQLRIHRFTNVKKQGDYALTFVRDSITRDVWGVRDDTGATQCSTPGSSYQNTTATDFVMNFDVNKMLIFGQQNGYINYTVNDVDPSNGNIIELFNTTLTDGTTTISNFRIECYKKTAATYPIIGFQFDISTSGAAPTQQEDIVLHYQTRVKDRKSVV